MLFLLGSDWDSEVDEEDDDTTSKSDGKAHE